MLKSISKLTCPKCSQRGTATWRYSLGPDERDRAELAAVSPGFSYTARGRWDEPMFLCQQCALGAEEKRGARFATGCDVIYASFGGKACVRER